SGHALAIGVGVGGGGTGPHAANGSSIAYSLWASVSLTHSTSLFLIVGCQLCDTPNVTGSHSTSPGLRVGSPTNEPSGRATDFTKVPSFFLSGRIADAAPRSGGHGRKRTERVKVVVGLTGSIALTTPTATPVMEPAQPEAKDVGDGGSPVSEKW